MHGRVGLDRSLEARRLAELGDACREARADRRVHRRAERCRLLHLRHVHRHAEHVGDDLRPQAALGRAAGEDRLGDVAAGDLLDDLEVADGRRRPRLSSIARMQSVAPAGGGSPMSKPRKPAARVHPALGVHQVREDARHAVRSGRAPQPRPPPSARRRRRRRRAASAPSRRRRTRRGTSACDAAVEADALDHPLARHARGTASAARLAGR